MSSKGYKYLFIGPLNLKGQPKGGDQYKNRLILENLSKTDKVIFFDTWSWKGKPYSLFQLLLVLVRGKFDKIIISTAVFSAYYLIRAISLFPRISSKVYYMSIGGYLPIGFKAEEIKAKPYDAINSIIVEGQWMKDGIFPFLNAPNVFVVPNFKPINFRPQMDGVKEAPPFRFVFISRITPKKGVAEIFQAAALLVEKGYAGQFTIDFYGGVDSNFKEDFTGQLNDLVQYRGFLKILGNEEEAYTTLSTYHCMLFPTYWPSEGFAGVLLDAMISGLPVITTHWNMNEEVIKDGVNGLLVEARNSFQLAEAMEYLINNPGRAHEMGKTNQLESEKHDTAKVWPSLYDILSS